MRNEQAASAALPNYIRSRSADAYGNPLYWSNFRLPSPYNLTNADVEDLARYLLTDSEFELLRLGTWLGSPAGHVIATAVEQALPPTYRLYAQLFVSAISRAAELEAAGRQDAARKVLLGGLVAAGVLATVLLSGRSA